MNDQPCQYLDGAEDHRLSRPSDLSRLNAALECCAKLETDYEWMVNQCAYDCYITTSKEVRRVLGDAVQRFQAQLESIRQLRRQLEKEIPIDNGLHAGFEARLSVDSGADPEYAGGRHD